MTMNPGRMSAAVLAALLSLAALAAEPDMLAPRWTQELSDVGRAVTTIPVAPSRPWIRTSDGGTLVALSYGAWSTLTLHRFDSSGTLLVRTRAGLPVDPQASGPGRVVLRAGLDGDAWMLLVVASLASSCEVIHISATGGILQRWPQTSGCVDLQLLASGDLAVLGTGSLRVVAPDGMQRWAVAASGGAKFFSTIRLANGQVWVAARGDMASLRAATLYRFDSAGVELGRILLPTTPDAFVSAGALAHHPDGGAIWVGSNPAFAVRLTPEGDIMWSRSLPQLSGLDSVGADDTGAIHVQSSDDGSLYVLDPANGDVLWTTHARDAVIAGAGLAFVVSRGEFEDRLFRLRHLDASGAIRSETVIADPKLVELLHLHGRDDGSVEFIARYNPDPETEECPADMRVLRVEPAGSTDTLAEVCTVPVAVMPFELLPAASDGVLLRASSGLAAYSSEGRLRWQHDPCPNCLQWEYTQEGPLLSPLASTQDGGAWLVEQSSYPDVSGHRIIRIGSGGQHQVEQELTSLPSFGVADLHMAASDDAAMLFWSSGDYGWGDFGWARFGSDGSRSTGSITIAEAAWIRLLAVREIVGGDYLVALTPDIYPWNCPPVMFCGTIRTVLLRIAPTGAIVWRHDVALEDGYHFALDRSGDSWVAANLYSNHRLQRISPDGQADPWFIAAPLAAGDHIAFIHTPIENRMLIREYSGMQLVGLTGDRLAQVAWNPPYPDHYSMLQSRHGYLASTLTSDGYFQAALYDAFDLSLRAVARMPAPTHGDADSVRQRTTQLEDGSIAIAQGRIWPDGVYRAYLSSFALTGTPAATRVWRDGFEP